MNTRVQEKPKTVAVWVHHGLGDVIMALPMLAQIGRSLPKTSRLILIVKSSTEEGFLQLMDWRNAVSFINLGHYGSWSYQAVLRLAMALRRQRPDIFLAPHASAGLLPAVFAKLAGAAYSVGPEGHWWRLGFDCCVPPLPMRHKVEYYSDFARIGGLFNNSERRVDLLPDEDNDQLAHKLLTEGMMAGRWVICAPGSSVVETHKRWPLNKYKSLFEQLTGPDSGINVALIGSPGEINMLEELHQALPAKRSIIVAQHNLGLTLALLRKGHLLLSGCTGAAHMAALVGTPVVGIYGPTNHSTTGPYTSLLRLVRQGYKCSPCYRPGFEGGCGVPRCMVDISTEQVKDAILDILDGRPYLPIPQLQTTQANSSNVEVNPVS